MFRRTTAVIVGIAVVGLLQIPASSGGTPASDLVTERYGTSTPHNSWAYSTMTDPSGSHDTEYAPVPEDYEDAKFVGYVVTPPDGAWGGADFGCCDSTFYIFRTQLWSPRATVLPLSLGGDDGHSLVVNGRVVTQGGFGTGQDYDLRLPARTPVTVEVAGYNAPSPWVFILRVRGTDQGILSAPDVQVRAPAPPVDVNADGYADLVVGAPREDVGSAADAGRITAVLGGPDGVGTAGGATWDQESVGLVSERGDQFGAAVVADDLDVDGRTDLAIAVPGEDGGAGRVVVVPGSPEGMSWNEAIVLGQGIDGVAGAAEPGDGFGRSLAASGLGARRLHVGAPLEDVGSAVDAGAVTEIRLDDALAVVGSAEYVQGTDGVPGTPEAQDHFGASLAAGNASDLVIGAPDQDVGSVVDAGVVIVNLSKEVSQDSPGVAGAAERGDRFGAAISVGVGPTCEDNVQGWAVGVPGEDVGTVPDAGSVALFLAAGRADAVVDNRVERNDRFGSTLQGMPYGLVVGAPGEDVGPVVDAGAVTALGIDCDDQGRYPRIESRRVVNQSSAGVPGAAERGDAFGAALSATAGHLVVGVPGEALGATAAAGGVTLLDGYRSALTATGSRWISQSTAGVPGTSERGDRFGGVLSTFEMVRGN